MKVQQGGGVMSDDYVSVIRPITHRFNQEPCKECDRLKAELADTKADYLRRHKDAGDRYEEIIRLRALAADLRNRLYLRGENVDEADAVLMGISLAPPGKEE